MYHFGIGFASTVPAGATPTPGQFALLKGISVDQSVNLVEESGQWQWTVAVGAGKKKLSGKIDSVSIFSNLLGQMLSVTPVAGSVLGVPGEIGTIPTTPFQVTVTNSATWVDDQGVMDLTTGKWMTRGATASATQIYSVAAGVYTFNTADVGHKVAIAYRYNAAASIGSTISVVNTPMQLVTGIKMGFYTPVVGGTGLGMNLYSVFFPKLSLAFKPDGFVAQNVEWFAGEDGTSGKKVCDIYTAE